MADQGYSYTRLPRQLAIIAVIINLVVFALNMGWLLLLSPHAAEIRESYSYLGTILSVLGNMPGSLALIYVAVYGSTWGSLERGAAASLASPDKAARAFAAVFLGLSVLLLLLSFYTTPRIILAVQAWGPNNTVSEVMTVFSVIMLVVNIVETLVICLLSRAAAFKLARAPWQAQETAVVASAAGSMSPTGFPVPPAAGVVPGSEGAANPAANAVRVAAVVCALSYYVIQTKTTNVFVQAGAVHSTDLAMAWRIAAVVLAPVIPALLAYLGVRRTLADRVDVARPQRAAWTGISTFIAAQVALALVAMAWVAGSEILFSTRPNAIALTLILLATHLLVVMPLSRAFSYLFYRAFLRGQANAVPEQAPAT
jgi:hypothetical protein